MFKEGKVGAVIVAAGKSERLGEDKMFTSLSGRPVLERTVAVFEDSSLIDEIVIVLGEHNMEKGRQLASKTGWKKITVVCLGGMRRQDSVAVGLKELKSCQWILVHDGARPLVTPKLIEDCLEAAVESGAAACAVPLRDTVKMVGEDCFVIGTPPREKLWTVQTPQAFSSVIINGAYSQAEHDATDDAALVERSGGRVKLCSGSYENVKITTPEDLALAGLLWQKRSANDMRVGIGYDVHRLAPGHDLMLGGVKIPFDHGLIGWSDADVLTHAVIDALLGAASLGDIGTHFPPGDPQYKNVSSLLLLARVKEMLAKKGFNVNNVDVIIAAEQPPLKDYGAEMCCNISRALGIDKSRVNVKASTNEELGFVGREEGIAVWATASLMEVSSC